MGDRGIMRCSYTVRPLHAFHTFSHQIRPRVSEERSERNKATWSARYQQVATASVPLVHRRTGREASSDWDGDLEGSWYSVRY
ncbi:hypothetical protein FA15DRAFT_488767 [Coprinopsis marcescibilis]|uniref:Uncharacterized protein n=1 Tax=Coprinopsis marcescibilis TaxID=230819 RepID=A0A5C3KTC4_COPMA|nr:hypothetical protein FA15DRAFT_488767 [Coprinopsis marcescibilis]